MKKPVYYKKLIETLLSEQPEDDLPNLPSRAEIQKRKFAHQIKMGRIPKWFKPENIVLGLYAGDPEVPETLSELRVPLKMDHKDWTLIVTFELEPEVEIFYIDAEIPDYRYTVQSIKDIERSLSSTFDTTIDDIQVQNSGPIWRINSNKLRDFMQLTIEGYKRLLYDKGQ